jgi:hypothetical protein
MAELLSARKLRESNQVKVDLGDGTFIRARREDMTLLVFEGRIPMPMLAAVQKMIDMPNASPAERIAALGTEHGRTLVEVLREHACKVAIEPKIVMTDDGNEDNLPVTFLDTQKLMTIWMATALIPEVTVTRAATFREGGSANDAPPLPTGPTLPKVTQHLDTPAVEFVSG